MARRTTPSTKGRTSKREAAPAEISEAARSKAPRRGRGAKLGGEPAPELSVTDELALGGDEAAAQVATPVMNEPAKARRSRAPKSSSTPETLGTDDEDLGTTSSSAPDTESVEEHAEPTMDTDTAPTRSATPPQKRRGRQDKVDAPSSASESDAAPPVVPQSSAARWDPETGTATFDWPSIEQVAATQGPNQAMAKLLLAARAEGANSRWPF